jgi:hypothetical protein
MNEREPQGIRKRAYQYALRAIRLLSSKTKRFRWVDHWEAILASRDLDRSEYRGSSSE